MTPLLNQAAAPNFAEFAVELLQHFVPGKHDTRRKWIKILGTFFFDHHTYAYAAVKINQITTAGSSNLT